VSEIPDDVRYQLTLRLPDRNTLPAWPDGISVRCWPITLPESWACPIESAALNGAEFKPVSFEALIAFFAFDVTLVAQPQPFSTRFVLNLPLENAPADRDERLLRLLLGNRQKVLQFLFFLLADDQREASDLVEVLPGGEGSRKIDDTGWSLPADLFETMVRALHRQPDRLVQVNRLVQDLKKLPESKALLPADFDVIWEPIWQAYRELHP
jgi:hypothetical protein